MYTVHMDFFDVYIMTGPASTLTLKQHACSEMKIMKVNVNFWYFVFLQLNPNYADQPVEVQVFSRSRMGGRKAPQGFVPKLVIKVINEIDFTLYYLHVIFLYVLI